MVGCTTSLHQDRFIHSKRRENTRHDRRVTITSAQSRATNHMSDHNNSLGNLIKDESDRNRVGNFGNYSRESLKRANGTSTSNFFTSTPPRDLNGRNQNFKFADADMLSSSILSIPSASLESSSLNSSFTSVSSQFQTAFYTLGMYVLNVLRTFMQNCWLGGLNYVDC